MKNKNQIKNYFSREVLPAPLQGFKLYDRILLAIIFIATFNVGAVFSGSVGMNIGTILFEVPNVQFTSIQRSVAAAPTTGLVGYWNFDETSGTSANDLSGNGNTGMLTNGPVWSPGKTGNGVQLDGTNDFVSIPDAVSLDLTTGGTLAAWFKRTGTNDWMSFFAKGNVNDNSRHNYGLEFDPSNQYVLILGNGSTNQTLTVAGTTDTTQFHHIVMTWNGTTVVLYIDGTQVLSQSQTVTPAGNTSPLYIGQFGGGVDRFKGIIDESRIYNRALSAAEVTSLYTADSGPVNPTVPNAPISASASASSSSVIVLTWSDQSQNEDGFSIERCSGSGCSNFAQVTSVTQNVTSYTDSGLIANTSYSYRVRAYNSAGNSSYSNTASATTQASLPPPTPGTGVNPALTNLPVNTWTKLSPKVFTETGSEITSQGFPWNAYSGIVYSPDYKSIVMFGGGGHGGRRGNEVWLYDTGANEWRRQYSPDPQSAYPYSADDSGMNFDSYCNSGDASTCNPSTAWQPRGSTSSDRPWTAHSYDQMAWDAYNQRYVLWAPNFIFGYNSCTYYYGVSDAFSYNVSTRAWTHLNTGPNLYHQMGAGEYDPDTQKIVAINGHSPWQQPCAKQTIAATWVMDVRSGVWTQRAAPPFPANDVNLVYDTVNRRMLAYGSDYPSSNELWAYSVSANSWQRVTPQADPVYGAPPAGAPHAAFDSVNGVMLLWGDGDEGSFIPTWAYDARTNRWKKMNASGEPGGQGVGANLIYDPINNVFFLVRVSGNFGALPGDVKSGELGELWAYRYAASGSTPSDTSAPTGVGNSLPTNGAVGISTSPTLTANSASDSTTPVSYQFELYQGSACSGSAVQSRAYGTSNSWSPSALLANTTYAWRNRARDAVSPVPNESAWGTCTTFTTQTATSAVANLTPNTWTKLIPTVLKPGYPGTYNNRAWSSAAYDSVGQRIVVWEGYNESGVYANASCPRYFSIYSNSMWAFNAAANTLELLKANNWSNVSSGDWTPSACSLNASDPTPMNRHPVLTYVTDTNALYAFGGLMSRLGSHPEDTWKFNLSSRQWTQLAPSSHPSSGAEAVYHSMAYDPWNRKVVIANAPASPYGTKYTWLFDIQTNQYEMLSTGSKPELQGTQGGSILTYDSLRHLIWAFGASSTNEIYTQGGNELWQLNVATKTWQKINPIGSLPPNRIYHGFVYIPVHDVFMLYGGSASANGSSLRDTWIYTPSTNAWTQLSVTGPTGSTFIDMAYDVANDVVVAQTIVNDDVPGEWWVFRYVPSGSTPTVPSTPTTLVASAASSSQINLSWADVSNNETGFKVERCSGSSCSAFTQIATTGANVEAYEDTTSLSAATLYRYRVRAYNATGNSGYSNIAEATTLSAGTGTCSVTGITDPTLVLTEPTTARPALYSTYQDPRFNTCMQRVTDSATMGAEIVPIYSEIQAWNADQTKILLADGTILNASSYSVFRNAPYMAAQRWSPTEANIIYSMNGNRFQKYDIQTGTFTTLRTFSEYTTLDKDSIQQEVVLDRSTSHLWVALQGTLVNGNHEIFPYNISTNTKGTAVLIDPSTPGRSCDHVLMSPSARYVLLQCAQGTVRWYGMEAFNRDGMSYAGKVHTGNDHGDVIMDANGAEWLVAANYNAYICTGSDGAGYQIVKARIPDGYSNAAGSAIASCADGESQGRTIRMLTHFAKYGMHISCRNSNDPYYCVISTEYGALNPPKVFEDEIFKLFLDSTSASPHVQRLAHHRSDPEWVVNGCASNSSYWNQPHATVRRDGGKIIFGSSWDRRCGEESYVIELAAGSPPPAPTDTAAPSGVGNLSPANGALGVSTSTTLTASAATDATNPVSYYFELYQNAVCSGTPVQTRAYGTATSWNPTQLAYSTTYAWRNKARDAVSPAPNESAFGGCTTFTTSAAPDTAPPTGVGNALPAHLATNVSITPSITANTATDATLPISYYFELYQGASCVGTPVQTRAYGTATIWNPAALANSTTYAWRNRARDAASPVPNESSFGTCTTFTTTAVADTVAPTGVGNASPAHLASNISLTPTLTANAAIDSTNPVSYYFELYQGNQCSGSTLQTRAYGTAVSWSPTTLSYSTAYAWRNKARDAVSPAPNESAFGQCTAFSTLAAPDTTPPTITNGSPSGTLPIGTTQTTIAVTTNEAAICRYGTTNTTYAMLPNQFATTGNLSHSSLVAGLQNGQNYTYYVRCLDQSGNTNTASYSIVFSVAADTTPPTISNVASGSINQTSAIITWTTNEASDSEVAYGTTIAYGTTQLSNPSVTDHSVPLANLTPGTVYHYHVRSTDASNNTSAWSADQAFTTDAPLQQPLLCGNGIIDTGEECDGANLGTASCTTLGFASGTVSCSVTCTFVTSQCVAPVQCTEQWSCSDWTSCSGNTQTRTCSDVNSCGTITNRPSQTQSCSIPSAGGGGGGGGGGGSSTGGGIGLPPALGNVQQPTSTAPAVPYTPGSEGNTSSSVSDIIKEVIARERARFKKIDSSLVTRLLGKILLQVEESGEAWYLNPATRLRYYLANGSEAYQMLRKFGLGITNADLAKIVPGIEPRFQDIDSDGDKLPDKMEEGLKTDINDPDSDNDGFSDGDEILAGYNPLGQGTLTASTALVNRLKGRILLQVEEKGQAWYVHPVDGKRYYMKNGEAAYQIMRFLSLGIRNIDLDSIPIGE